MPLSPSGLKLLGQYDTPTIANVIELFEVRPRNTGYMDQRVRACFSEMPPIVGYASTAAMRTNAPLKGGGVYSSLDDQVARFAELDGPAIVVFQDLDEPAVAATFGEVMCSTYQCFGALGIVTSGPGRDLDQVRRLGFAAFTNGVNCAHAYSHITSVHEPVRVGGLDVYPGDLLHADVNGVCNIPVDIAADVAHAAAAYVAAEAVVIDYARSGRRDLKAYSEARQETMRLIGELGVQVRRKRASERMGVESSPASASEHAPQPPTPRAKASKTPGRERSERPPV
jgi:4-hydroxy-4-methyl-2-oxoglutarate aldolase